MSAVGSSLFGLSFKSVALAACATPGEEHIFLSGTSNPRDSNELHILQVQNGKLSPRAVLPFQEEIRSIVTSPNQSNIFFVLGQSKGGFSSILWKLNSAESKFSLEQLAELKGHNGKYGLVWRNSESGSDHVMTFDQDYLRLWALEADHHKVGSSPVISGSALNTTAGAFDPHHEAVFVSVADRAIRLWDTRVFQKETAVFERCHEDLIRDIDFNPNKLYS